ncbi:hypothetical protein D3C85_473840 [compost metagenome]
MPRRIKDKAAKKQFATEHCLHHYHIGVPNYTPSSDGGVSDKYLHYQLFTNENGKMEARFVGIDNHNPFKPPEQSRLVKP